MLRCDFLEGVECDTNYEFFRRVRSIGCNENHLVFDFSQIHNFEPGLIKTIAIAQRFAMLDNKKIIYKGIPKETMELLESKTNVAVAF